MYLNCPFCIVPLSYSEYNAHVSSCERRQPGLLKDRMTRWGTVTCSAAEFSDEFLAEYLAFLKYEFLPAHWSDTHDPERNTVFVDVYLACEEGRRVVSLIQGQVHVTKIERVQNKELYMKYLETTVTESEGREEFVFHGTSAEASDLIANQGFDAGMSKNGSHGYGIYVSNSASFSAGYAKGSKRVFVCRAWMNKVPELIQTITNDFLIYPEYVVHFSGVHFA